MKRTFQGLLAVLPILVLSLGMSQKAEAVFQAAVCNDLACSGGDDIIVTDNGAGDTIGALGAINFSTSAFGYSLLVNTSQSKPIIGSATSPQLDLTFSATSGAGGGTVFLYTSDTDFLDPTLSPEAYVLSLGGTQSVGTGTVTGRAWGGTNNTVLSFSGANLINTVGPLTGAAFSQATTGSFTPTTSPFSLTIGTAISRTVAGTTTGDLNFNASPVPEPASITLFGLCLIGLGAITHRRKLNQNS